MSKIDNKAELRFTGLNDAWEEKKIKHHGLILAYYEIENFFIIYEG